MNKWNVWVGNDIIEEKYPISFTRNDVMRAANNRYGGKAFNVSSASIGGNESEKSSSSSSYSSSGSTEALFGLIGLGVVGTYHLTKFTVVSSYKVTKFTVNKIVVPTTKFTFNNVVVPSAKYIWKGMKYVATTTVPQVYSFTKNTVIPGVVKLTSDIIEFLTELVNKVMGNTTNYPKVQSQYRKEVI